MKIKRCIPLLLAVSLAGTALTYRYAWCDASAVKSPSAVDTQPAVPPLITTALPVKRVFTLRVPWIGVVESRASVDLTALAAGRIEAIEAEDEAEVEEGRLVMRVGGPQIEGQRAGLTAEIDSLKSRLNLARRTVIRLEANLKARLATKDQVATAQDAQITLQIRLRKARLRLETFQKLIRITAPMNGIFTDRRVSVGQEVNSGQIVGKIIDAVHQRIKASFFPPQGRGLQDKEAIIRLDQDRTLTARVRRVLPRSGRTGAVMAWLEGPQIDKHLRPGQTVGGNIILKAGPEILAVPESAIVYDAQERSYLFIQKERVYEPRPVRLGLIQDGWVEVLSGLEPGQSVVTKGAYELFHRRFNKQFKVQD
jgi:RND family efflux transporter MFP subunit